MVERGTILPDRIRTRHRYRSLFFIVLPGGALAHRKKIEDEHEDDLKKWR